MLMLGLNARDGNAHLERHKKKRQKMSRQLQSLLKRPLESRRMTRSHRASLVLKADPSPSHRLESLRSAKKSQRKSSSRRRSPKKRRTDQPTKGDRSRQSPLIATRKNLKRQLRRSQPTVKWKRRASRSPERQIRSQTKSSTTEVMPSGSAQIIKVISLVVRTPIQKATEATAIAVAVTMVVGPTTNSNIIGHLTTVVAVATGCTMVACTRAGATETGSSVRASTKDLARSEHLVVPLSPQVMVVQEGRRLMTSSTTKNISRNANFQPDLLRRSNPESDELLGLTGGVHRVAWLTRLFVCLKI
jgi:hypothetical protein